MSFFVDYFDKLTEKIKDVDLDMLNQATEMIVSTSRNGGKTIIVGNGGSAATASHVSVDLTKNANVRSVNFNEADMLTCFSNDYGYEKWVEKAVDFYADSGDLVILISSSGTSKNIINGGRRANAMGLKVITFSGFSPDNPLQQHGDINFWVDSKSYNIIEMTHSIWLLAIVDQIIGNMEYSA
ncbi:unnamed protein product [marine sediment metagenome]|uniref:SIS domain-containing protein n=1 Tax=marine sediment metagenome TaxID=412755 RepID=X0VYC4_9ZZZZ